MAFHPSPYENLKDEEIKDKFDQIIAEWEAFLLSQKLSIESGKDYFIHKKNLTEVIIRCDKRRVYMEMFHKLEHLSEYKIIAMESFWINTLTPFMVVNNRESMIAFVETLADKYGVGIDYIINQKENEE